MNEEALELVSENLQRAVAAAVAQIGTDVTMALLIHCLHEVSLRHDDEQAA